MNANPNQAYSDTTKEQREAMHKYIDIDKIKKTMKDYDDMADTGEYKRFAIIMSHRYESEIQHNVR